MKSYKFMITFYSSDESWPYYWKITYRPTPNVLETPTKWSKDGVTFTRKGQRRNAVRAAKGFVRDQTKKSNIEYLAMTIDMDGHVRQSSDTI